VIPNAWFAATAIAVVVIYLTQGSPAHAGASYVPFWACFFGAIFSASVPGLTVVLSVRHLMRGARERRALASDSPALLPPSLD